MLLSIDKWGGTEPKIKDQSLLPGNKSETSKNCRFDKGGLAPLYTDNPIQASTKKDAISLYVYYNEGTRYFLTWNIDVDAVKAPVLNDQYNRIFFTENGQLKVTDKSLFNQGGTDLPMVSKYPSPPVPADAPVAVCNNVSGSDPTLIQTRGYVYTLVNSYGEEGPESPVSNLIDCYDGNQVDLSGIDISFDPMFDIQTKRIYRLNQTSTGTAQYQFVAEILIGDTSYSDTLLDDSLGKVLATAEWEGPPMGIKGIISLPDGGLAGFANNMICRSVPNYPYAWPVSYQKATDRNIVSLGAFGMTVVALTEGTPYLQIGNDPSNTSMERMDIGLSCMSKRGKIQWGEIVVYPSPEGLVAIGPGTAQVVTAEILAREDWLDLYNPSTITAFYWEAKYVGFYRDKQDNGAGFIFDFKTKDLIDLNFWAYAGYSDLTDGTLYLLIDGNIVAFNQGSDYRSVDYRTKKYRFPMSAFGVIKVIASAYPVSIDIIYYLKDRSGNIEPRAIMVSVETESPVRLPTFIVDTCEVEISGKSEITAVYLATTMEEIPV